MTEPLSRPRLAIALAVSLLLHLLLVGGLRGIDHTAEPDDGPVIHAALVAPPPPPPPEPEPVPAARPAPKAPPKVRRPRSVPPVSEPVDGTAAASPASQPALSASDDGVAADAGTGARDQAGEDHMPPVGDDAVAMKPQDVLPGEAKIEFEVYRGDALRIGESRYHWVHDGQRYRMDTVTETTGLAALLKPLRIDQRSEGELADDGLRPQRFSQISSSGKPPEETVVFDWAGSRVMLRSGAKTMDEALTPGAQDMASLWLEVIWRAQYGGSFDFAVATGRRYSPRWFVPDEDSSSLETGLGRLLVKRVAMRALPGDNQIEVWLAPDLRWLPVRIRYTDRKGDVYDQRVRRIEYDQRTLTATSSAPTGSASPSGSAPAPDSDLPIFLR
ncbi:DUF3108 domain-containing protein [Methyloversatilis universalis]|uniref:DUF3108 domain-containing protein n=1 Tax=Methyloversatilis universalis TaxID=378211 RepID=UPI00037D51F8|nr:DUF3108 domain-containing protein [Methyloversatilis universalis]